jgi:CubicO group peptidase (beta-lactamase class C family)
MFRALWFSYFSGNTGPVIDEGHRFPYEVVSTGNPQAWPISSNYDLDTVPLASQPVLEDYETVAFLVIDNDSLVYENYSQGFGPESHSNSFSMAKTVVSMLIGKALEDGYIESLDQPVSDFLPELKVHQNNPLRIRHLLTMSSGIDFGESYSNPFGFVAKAYYGNDLRKLVMQYSASDEPGTLHRYQGGDTQLLAFVLEKATGTTVPRYFSKSLWTQIGAEEEAWWNTDEQGAAKASCCIHSNARDFARLGQLYLDSGRWNEVQIIPQDYVLESLRPCEIKDVYGESCYYYGYQWWLGKHRNLSFFYLRGMQGQYIVVIPEKNMVFVRLGRKRSEEQREHIPLDLFEYIDLALSLNRFD